MPESLAHLVTRQAERRPEAVAVVDCGRALTYAELEVRSRRLALRLLAEGCGRGDRVCLLMPKSLQAIVGLLGIYRASCIYVPLDPSSPAPRLAKMIDSCAPRFILAGGPVGRTLDEILEDRQRGSGIAVGWLDDEPPGAVAFRPRFAAPDVSGGDVVPGAPATPPLDTAHILFTSGSTGTPKGVVITHANVLHFVDWATRYFGMEASDRVSCHPPLHFDLSLFDIFGAFAVGAELHLVPPQASLLPTTLAEFIRASRLTQWFSVPSVLNYMAKFDVVRPGDFPELKRLLWCGEVFPTPALAYWMRRLPHVSFTNLYGPTEATIASSYYTVPGGPASDRQAIPIGTACDGEELLILDDHLKPVGDGEVGNLYIGGRGLSPGYWEDPQKTREVFLSRNGGPGEGERIYRTGDLARRGEDGLVYFVGRADAQVKSRGYRIELGEIETCLGALDGVRECAVVAIPTDQFEGTILCCAYVPAEEEMNPTALRQGLGRLLPAHMLPARWQAYDRLPRNANGKIDRAVLKETFERHEAASA
jgi:amino acid adenylation domain-containing protein